MTLNMKSDDGVLTRGSFGWSIDGNFSSVCPNGSVWIWEGLGECAQDSRDVASVAVGLLSIVCFMVSSIPQYYSSCKSGNMDRALSIWFLLLWLGGDSCNLVGSFLADQLPLQTYTAVYYVLADLLMLGMYFYYVAKNRMNNNRLVLNVIGLVYFLGFSTSLVALPGLGSQQDVVISSFTGRALLSTTVNGVKAFSTKEIIGLTIGSISSVLYLCSRLPQMYINYMRKSTQGVSYFLFALVILGNTTYGLSVLLKNPERGQGEGSYIIHHLPWLVGSLGTLSLDLLISIQFLIYRNSALLELESHLDERAALLDK
ncbi:lysosomal amino acid transporter 1 homolog isoform X1 [Esox lucius]|uniref:Lysosomal amino acid transporter 1 homolog n=1 Tax=Esox lucius TaxID=8010 RepID=A0A3P9A4T4_ESOLU|nr:lysosomal amino acid transporter 1 homolog isoform X1 [Esox lucius]XP_010897070.1 lysosomal amino acid transporter 1 homolog isoform X1 [Esox lucius]XP_010897071.1 lysosomal amino acid transporter 1 homolog isoform X1 [Esox lucius]XP_034151573.1 lysosomal amino acid transporter 1 homolog isoform X1 [Esox lucius]